MINAFIFDLDGVLVSTEVNHFNAWKKIADSLSIPFNEKENEKIKGLSRLDSLNEILKLRKLKLKNSEKEVLLKKKNKDYLDSLSNLSEKNLMFGIKNVLNETKQKNIKLAIGSSSRNAKFILNKLNIIHYFDVIFDGTNVKNPKPNPEVFLKSSSYFELSPSKCLVFEDSLSGVQAAKKGGFNVVAVGNKKLSKIADYYIDDFVDFEFEKICKS